MLRNGTRREIMLKITEIPFGGGDIVLKIEGKLMQPWLVELTAFYDRATNRARSVSLDLSAVSFADFASVQFLRVLLERGVAIISCSGFLAELLRQERRK
jgi:hypothetical protein